jgi:two-component system response regulator RegA
MSTPAVDENTPHLLVIDDDEAFNRVLSRALGRRGYAVFSAHTPDEALALARAHDPEYIVLDLNIGGESGLKLIRPLLETNPDARILVLTGYASITTAVEAVKLGATQYLAKPADVSAILHALNTGEAAAQELAADAPMSVSRLEWWQTSASGPTARLRPCPPKPSACATPTDTTHDRRAAARDALFLPCQCRRPGGRDAAVCRAGGRRRPPAG